MCAERAPQGVAAAFRTGALIDRSLRFAIELQAQVLGFEAAL